MSAKTRPPKLTERERRLIERERQRIQRRLQYEEQPRTLWGDDLQRIGRLDENKIIEKVRERETQEKADAKADAVGAITGGIRSIERDVANLGELIRDHHLTDRRRYRDLDLIRRTLAHLLEGITT